MIKIFLRQLSINLSFFFEKKVKYNKKKHLIAEKYVSEKVKNLYFKNPRLSVHKKLSFEILNLIKKKKLTVFLRNSLIQNIFFIHNRLFIYFELKELKNDKNWNIWKRLIKDSPVGHPVWYFLYPKSSGNRIRQVYIIKKFIDLNPKVKLKKINKIIEIGGGYGCMADIFLKINKNINYTIYDMYEVNLLQYYYLRMNNHNPKLNLNRNSINLINKLSDLKKNNNNSLTIANWSLSEFPFRFRNKFIPTIKNSKYTIISFQKEFEKINNYDFFIKLIKKLGSKYVAKIDTFKYYNNSFLNKNKHYLLTIQKKMKINFSLLKTFKNK